MQKERKKRYVTILWICLVSIILLGATSCKKKESEKEMFLGYDRIVEEQQKNTSDSEQEKRISSNSDLENKNYREKQEETKERMDTGTKEQESKEKESTEAEKKRKKEVSQENWNKLRKEKSHSILGNPIEKEEKKQVLLAQRTEFSINSQINQNKELIFQKWTEEQASVIPFSVKKDSKKEQQNTEKESQTKKEQQQKSKKKENQQAREIKQINAKREQYRPVLEYFGTLIQYYFIEDVEIESLIEETLAAIKADTTEDQAIKDLFSRLNDPYSDYYTREENKEIQESSKGIYYGIGAQVSQDRKSGVITVVLPFAGGPAERAGIKIGDVIVKVDGQEVVGMELEEVIAKMKGAAGTQVIVTVQREKNRKPIDFTIIRNPVEVQTVIYEMLKEKIGYVKITEFDEVTVKQFEHALFLLRQRGMEGLIIDLRNNPGGRLDSVTKMLDIILPEGLLVYTKDKYGNRENFFSDSDRLVDVPMVVLINEGSASASEIFAGAVQDYKAATLVGTTSFGKGIVQSLIEFTDGTAMKLTVSNYYTPLGRNIHKIGIQPDIEVVLNPSAANQVILKQEEDNQLQKAIEIMKQKVRKQKVS